METGRACDTHVEKKNILRVMRGKGMRQPTTEAWAWDDVSYRIKTGARTGVISSASGHVSWVCRGCIRH
jgi:hypothetical protein